jgi:hypothetical protein
VESIFELVLLLFEGVGWFIDMLRRPAAASAPAADEPTVLGCSKPEPVHPSRSAR